MFGVTPQDMSVIGCTVSFGRIVYTYEGYRIAGAQAQNKTNRRVKGEGHLLECMACFKQSSELWVVA